MPTLEPPTDGVNSPPESEHSAEKDQISDEALAGLPADGKRVVRLMAQGGWASGKPSRAAVERTARALGLNYQDEIAPGEPRAFWPSGGQGPIWRRLAARLDEMRANR